MSPRSTPRGKAPTNLRRVDGLEMTPIQDGFMIHQPDKDRVHYLNHTAALVLELSDGQRGVGEIATLLQQAYKLRKSPLAEVREAQVRMLSEGLLESRSAGAPKRRVAAPAARKKSRATGTRASRARKAGGRKRTR